MRTAQAIFQPLSSLFSSAWCIGVVTVRRLAVRVRNSHAGERIREIRMHCLCYRHVALSVAWVFVQTGVQASPGGEGLSCWPCSL